MLLPKRNARRIKLNQSGLLPFEALTLSQIPKHVPYMDKLASQRRAMLAEIEKTQPDKTKARNELTKRVETLYHKNGWQGFGTSKGAWEMLRHFEDAHKKEHPKYEQDRGRYPLKSHHKNGEVTARKLHNSLGIKSVAELTKELEQYPHDSPRYIKTQELIDKLNKAGK